MMNVGLRTAVHHVSNCKDTILSTHQLTKVRVTNHIGLVKHFVTNMAEPSEVLFDATDCCMPKF